MLGPLSYLDAALIAIALLSGLLAMYRGFTREILSILSWIVAAGATVAAVPAEPSSGVGGDASVGSTASGRLLLLAVHPQDAVDVAVSQVGQLLTYLRSD